jgi:hypothetical protein
MTETYIGKQDGDFKTPGNSSCVIADDCVMRRRSSCIHAHTLKTHAKIEDDPRNPIRFRACVAFILPNLESHTE